jgi:pimeloyl-ACP methyl ester carboxylesterase
MKYADDEFTSARDWQTLLPAVRCRTLIVRGAGSALVSANAAKQMARMPRRGELVTVPRAGHAVMSDNPQAFCASIAAFVSSVTAA